MRRGVPLGLTAMSAVWLAALLLAPLAVSRGMFAVPTLVVYEAASLVCHQRPDRSFHPAGIQTPVCGRCLGLYAAAAVGAIAVQSRRRGRPRTVRAALGLAAVPMLLSVALESIGVVGGSNLARFASALPFGLVAAWTLIGLFFAADAESHTLTR